MVIDDEFPKANFEDAAHAALLVALLRWLRQFPGVKTYCEVPYNHYGQRGFIDLVAVVQPQVGQPWRGIACEVKPAVVNLGESIRQVRRAEAYFCHTDSPELQDARLRFPLIFSASPANFATAHAFSEILDGVEVHFFDPALALRNPFEQAWWADRQPPTPPSVSSQ